MIAMLAVLVVVVVVVVVLVLARALVVVLIFVVVLVIVLVLVLVFVCLHYFHLVAIMYSVLSCPAVKAHTKGDKLSHFACVQKIDIWSLCLRE